MSAATAGAAAEPSARGARAPQEEHVPDFGAFGLAIAPSAPKARALKRLHTELGKLDPQASQLDREHALIRLAAWIKTGGAPPELAGVAITERAQVKRLRCLVAALEAFPAYAGRLAYVVGSILLEQRADALFAKVGIPGDRGLLTETIDRLSRRLMPQPIDEQDITHTLALMFPARNDVDWLAAIPAPLALRLIQVLRRPGGAAMRLSSPDHPPRSLQPSHSDLPLGALPSLPDDAEMLHPTGRRYSIWAPLRTSLLDAILILASRVSAAGLSDAIRARSPDCPLRESPFFRLPRTIDALLATPRHELAEILAWSDDCRAAMLECREACQAVLDRLEQTGVSVDVVYRLELIERSLSRTEVLLELLVTQDDTQLAERCTQLLSNLLVEWRRERSLSDILRTNTHLLARKIIERAGHSGEHYITVTPREYFVMLASAAGGGVVTAGTAALKFLIGKLQRPPLQEGLLSSLNYAGSFTLMQFLGLTLATKQPSMTAAALAGAVHQGGEDREELVTLIARLVRSQLAAAAGNVVVVIPAAVAVDLWWQSRFGAHMVTPAYAEKIMASFHPLQSGTIPFAIVTGGILWASSIAAGWLENWAVYRRLPEAIAEHRIRRVIGQRVTTWASRVFARNIAGIGGNVSIGLMLGLTYSVGQFVGIPVDVRHVTLSTGSLTYAVCSSGVHVMSSSAFQMAVLGIVTILALNLGVSFALAMVVAFRAREVPFLKTLRLPIDIAVGFARSPLRFFLPVEGASAKPRGDH